MTHKLRKNLDLILLFILSMMVFLFMIKNVKTDITDHIAHIKNINTDSTSYPPNFLFYLIINVLTWFSSVKLIATSIFLLSTAVVAKYLISKKIIIALNQNIVKHYSNNAVIGITLLLFFCFAIPDPFSVFVLKKLYLTRIVPVVWHNSTTIFLFPFSILLFWQQLKVLVSKYQTTTRDILILTVLVILNVTIKPSFIFAYIPVTFLFVIDKYRYSSIKTIVFNLLPVIIAALSIFVQYFLIYKLQLGSFQKASSTVTVSTPFKVFSYWVPIWYIPIAFLFSFALPVYTIIAYREIIKYKPFVFSLSLTVMGIIISAFVVEIGPRLYHGNFMWQNIICTYLLFLSTISFLAPKLLDKNPWSRKKTIVASLFILHALSGVIYLLKIVFASSYY